MDAETPITSLLQDALEKARKAARLYLHSARKVAAFDPQRQYGPDDLEPYDALVSRFERVVEVALKFFRTVERFETADTASTVRDCLGLMCKVGILDDVEVWMQMREVRNRIAHDYVPEKIKSIYDLLTATYRPLIEKCITSAESYVASKEAGFDAAE
jgi:nucleotidyltransferase substrate binding protein (TIGR01987 family)